MLNAEDAMGLQEDLARIRNAAPHPQSRWQSPPDESGNALAVAVAALQEDRNHIARMQRQLNATLSERNEVAALSKAARETVEHLARELAKVTGGDESESVERARHLLSRRFDANLDESIRRKLVLRDVRQIPEEMCKRSWYAPPDGIEQAAD